MIKDVLAFEDQFNEILFGAPLLTSEEDSCQVIEALMEEMGEIPEDTALVFMGHGTTHYANTVYAALDYRMKDMGYKNVFLGTVEAYPSLDTMKRRLRAVSYTHLLKEEQEKRICSLSLLEETLRQLKQEEKRILEQKNQVKERQQDQARLLEQNQISPILRKQVQDGVLLERELQKEEKEQGDIKTVRDRLLWETEEPVSYTHLDVYKRQQQS